MSDAIMKPFASGRGLPDKRAIAKAIEYALVAGGAWTHSEDGECEIDEFVVADRVQKLFIRHFASQTLKLRCFCGGTKLRWHQDVWYVDGDCYHRTDNVIVCAACDWRFSLTPRIVWEGYGAKGEAS